MHGHCHYDRVLSWSGAKQHSRRETPLLKLLHKFWCNAPRTCTRHQGVEQFFAPGAEWYPSLLPIALQQPQPVFPPSVRQTRPAPVAVFAALIARLRLQRSPRGYPSPGLGYSTTPAWGSRSPGLSPTSFPAFLRTSSWLSCQFDSSMVPHKSSPNASPTPQAASSSMP